MCDDYKKQKIRYLKGVGENRERLFEKLSVDSVGALLRHYPRGYIDLRAPVRAAEAPCGEPAAVRVVILRKRSPARIGGGRTMYKADAADDSAALTLTWFNDRFTPAALKEGERYLFYGKVEGAAFSDTREMVNPWRIKESETGGLMPRYPATEGLSSRVIGGIVKNAFALYGDRIEDPLPAEIREKYGLIGLCEALCGIHFPKDQAEAETAKKRLIFEELLLLQLGMLLYKSRAKGSIGAVMTERDPAPFLASLPFAPTPAQLRSIGEITRDFAKTEPMSRLLQGDVGSGKTAVAAAGIYCAAKSGFQSAVMAPTEILARQHADSFSKLLAPFGVSVRLLTSAVKGKERKLVLEQLKSGETDLAVGTHALIGTEVEYHNLGFVVADEQHRFGVKQRALLSKKGDNPHLLVMSATPIPRTLALMIYGDLDLSVLDQLPPGRKPVKTYLVDKNYRARYLGFLKKQIDAGRQAYIVCPLVEGGAEDSPGFAGGGERLAAAEYRNELEQNDLLGYSVGLIHGKLPPKEKAGVMARFQSGEIQILVSTTVVEVGVDVPNASLMIVENAELFGLSSLHQLRGRVGRGTDESFCILVSSLPGESSKARLRLMTETADGFEIARFDLRQRGPGDLFGRRQHGLPELRIADLMTDERALFDAQRAAKEILASDPELRRHRAIREDVERMFRETSGA